MKIYYEGDNLRIVKPVITIGMFDGVHRGHQLLIRSVREAAQKAGGESVILTFDPHPRILLSKDSGNLRFLTSLEEKKGLLEEAGIGHLVVMPFTRELSMTTACEFVERVLVGRFGIEHLVIGFDHHFGYRGQGASETITECADRFGFDYSRVEAVDDNGVVISSTTIRNWLADGRLQEANRLLGYEYFLEGRVVRGRKVGTAMGYPTANLVPLYPYKLVPKEGVYAVEAIAGGKRYKAMLYIGTRPTYEEWGGEKAIEVNIFDFKGDLYGENLTIIFRYRIRDDIKFETTGLLYRQIDEDKKKALELLDQAL